MNYTTASKDVSIKINKVTSTINWGNPAGITYGGTLGAAQLNATASVPGTFVYTPAAGTMLNAGTQTLHVDFTPTDTVNYNGRSKDVQIVVAKVTPTVSWANPAGIAHGTALSESQLNATASVPGTFVYTPAAGTILNAGTQTLHVDFTPTDSNYATVSKDVQISVSKVSSAITWSNPAGIPYGWPLSATQLNATASVPGTFVYTPAAGTVLTAGAMDPACGLHTDRHGELHHRVERCVHQDQQGDFDDQLGESSRDYLWRDAGCGAVECDGQCAGDVRVHAGGGDDAECGHADAACGLHADGHGELQRKIEGCADCSGQGDADGELGESGWHRPRHGAERIAVERDGQRAGDVRVHAAGGDGAECGHADPARGFHADRCRELQRSVKRSPNHSGQIDADDYLGQADCHLRNGAYSGAVERDGQRAGDVRVHAAGGNHSERGHTDAARGFHAGRYRELHDRIERRTDCVIGSHHPDDRLEQSGGDPLWVAAERNAIECHGKCAGHVRLYAGGGDGVECGDYGPCMWTSHRPTR